MNNFNQRRIQPSSQNRISPSLLPGVELENLKEELCTECGSDVFITIYKIKSASPLQSTSGVPTLLRFITGYACAKCHSINPISVLKQEVSKNDTPERKEVN